MHSAAEWVASIPDELTARDAMVYVETALQDARDAEKEILARYGSGTLPPPPWPKHPALVTALEAMDGGKIMLGKAIELGHGDQVTKKTDTRIAAPLLNAGRNLYREVAVMQAAMKGIEAKDLPRLATAAAKKFAENKVGGWVTFAAVVWILHNADDLFDA